MNQLFMLMTTNQQHRLKYYSRKVTNKVNMVASDGMMNIVVARDQWLTFTQLRVSWYGQKLLLVTEKRYDQELVDRFKKIEDKKGQFVIFGNGLGISSVDELSEGKFGLFHINNGKIERELHSEETLKEINDGKNDKNVLWVISQQYI